MSDRGRLIVFAAPAGAGKSSIIAQLRTRHPDWGFSVSATTRQPRTGEQDGREYYFLSRAEFQRRIQAGEFFEFEEVHGDLYGTLRQPTEARLSQGETLIFDLDVKGALNLKSAYPRAFSIFVNPPSLETLRSRLQQRGSETAESLERRMTRVAMELELSGHFDARVTNDNLERAVNEVETLIAARYNP